MPEGHRNGSEEILGGARLRSACERSGMDGLRPDTRCYLDDWSDAGSLRVKYPGFPVTIAARSVVEMQGE